MIPVDKRRSCQDTDSDKLAAYTFSSSDRLADAVIVFCPKFFAANQWHLDSVIYNLELHPTIRKHPVGMRSKGHIVLHELAHVAAIGEKYPSK